MPRVGRAAYALGFAGLLPAFAAVALLAFGRTAGAIVALFYPAIILSFLGGIWWGLAMRRAGRQGRLAAVAIAPSLVAAVMLVAGYTLTLRPIVSVTSRSTAAWPVFTLGVAIILTLLVDRHLVATGEAPAGWMRLRVPLSLGLGGLTIVSAMLLSRL